MKVRELLELLNNYYRPSKDGTMKITFRECKQGDVIMRSDNMKAIIPFNDRLVRIFYVVGDYADTDVYIDLVSEVEE